MKSIGEQAREFREAMGWTYTEMAKAVQRHAAGQKVNRQKIKQLEDTPERVPRYIAALARTMGTTVEALQAGEAVPHKEKDGSTDQPIAQDLSDLEDSIPLIEWEALMEDRLPSFFKVILRDDVFAPYMRAGDALIFERASKGKAGQIVLLSDGNGAFYPRKLRERLADKFIAFAPNDHYEPLDVDSLNLKVVGVCVRVVTKPFF
jgi:SOS-response transcriptional repressor LexA